MLAILLTLKGDEIGQVSVGLLNLVLPAWRLIVLQWLAYLCVEMRKNLAKFKVGEKTDTKWSREAKLCPAFKYPPGNSRPK